MSVKQPNNKKQDVAFVFVPNGVDASEVSVRVLSQQQIAEQTSRATASRIISSTIDIEVKRGVNKNRPITLCFKVDKRRLPSSSAQQQREKQRPDGGCRKVFCFFLIFEIFEKMK